MWQWEPCQLYASEEILALTRRKVRTLRVLFASRLIFVLVETGWNIAANLWLFISHEEFYTQYLSFRRIFTTPNYL